MSALPYLVFYDYHDHVQAGQAINEFKEKFIAKYETHLSEAYFNKAKINVTWSSIDLLETLHQAKHEIDMLSSFYLWNHQDMDVLKDKCIPSAFKAEKDKLITSGIDAAGVYSLIGNVMVANAFRQASCYAYWIVKLKPLIVLEIPEKDDKATPIQLKEYFTKYLNEYFAFYFIGGYLQSDTFLAGMSKELDKFLHHLRYKHCSPDFLSLFLEQWCKLQAEK